MPKSRSKKRTVRRNARKLKGLTVEDLIANPELLHSPQFQQLPSDKQMQLIAAVKQYLALHKPNQTQGVITGGVNNDLHAQLLASQQALQRKENEVEAYKQQIANNKAQLTELEATKKHFRDEEAAFKQEQQHKREMDILNSKMTALQDRMDNEEINDLQKQLNALQQKQRTVDVNRLEGKKAELIAQIKALMRNNQPTSGIPIPPSSPSEGMQRYAVERNIQETNNQNNLQSDLSHQAEAFQESGDPVNSSIAESNLNSMFKKNNPDDNGSGYTTLDNDDLNAIDNITQLQNDMNETQKRLELMTDTKEKREKINRMINNQPRELSGTELVQAQNQLTNQLFDLGETAGSYLNLDYANAFADAIDKFTNSHDINKLSKSVKYNQELANSYMAELQQCVELREKGENLLLELSGTYPKLHENGRKNIEAFRKKLAFTNDIYELSEVVAKIEEATKAAANNDLKAVGEIDNWLKQPIKHHETTTMYAQPPDFSPFGSPVKALNQPALQNVEVCTLTDIDLNADLDVDKIQNHIIMDNVDLKDLLQYWDKTDSRFKYVAGLMGKVMKAIARWGWNVTSDTVVVLRNEAGKAFIKNVFKGPVGLGLGVVVASKVKVPGTGGKTLLEVGTKATVNGTLDAGKTVLTELGKGLAESKVGQMTKSVATTTKTAITDAGKKVSQMTSDIANSVVDTWRRGLRWFGG